VYVAGHGIRSPSAKRHTAKTDHGVAQHEEVSVSLIESFPDDANAALSWPIDCERYEIKREPGPT